MSVHHQTWLLRTVLVLTGITTAISLGITIIGLPQILASASNTQAVRSGTDLQSCRALYSSRVTTANSDAIVLVLRGLSAVASKEPLDRIVDRSAEAQERIAEATDDYRRAVKLSISNPDKFMADCKALTN